jgi:hypothetical protein
MGGARTMSRTIYATHVQCDGCGAVEQLPAPSTGPPEDLAGWLPAGLSVVDLYRTPVIGDLCPACMARPLAELLEPQLAAAAESP